MQMGLGVPPGGLQIGVCIVMQRFAYELLSAERKLIVRVFIASPASIQEHPT